MEYYAAGQRDEEVLCVPTRRALKGTLLESEARYTTVDLGCYLLYLNKQKITVLEKVGQP